MKIILFALFVLSWLALFLITNASYLVHIVLLLLASHIIVKRLQTGHFSYYKSIIGIGIALSTLIILSRNGLPQTQPQEQQETLTKQAQNSQQTLTTSPISSRTYSPNEIQWTSVDFGEIRMMVPANSLYEPSSFTSFIEYSFDFEEGISRANAAELITARFERFYYPESNVEGVAYQRVLDDVTYYESICGGKVSPLTEVYINNIHGWTFEADCLGEIHSYILHTDTFMVEYMHSLQRISDSHKDAYRMIIQEMVASMEAI